MYEKPILTVKDIIEWGNCEGIYVNGKKVNENISVSELQKIIGRDCTDLAFIKSDRQGICPYCSWK
ncbi:MAG TPA: hypothetical protein PLK35_03000, partial [Candidatus Moranbacteria bacterium]|nr:hypothetical protein [Candidatus Moranbacteria bacterium]